MTAQYRCDAVRCDRDGVEQLIGDLPAVRGHLATVVRVRLWLCPEHAEQMLLAGMRAS